MLVLRNFLLLFVFVTGAHAGDKPTRIVALTPAVAELCADFFEADLDRIVGVSTYTDYPPALASKPTIANHAEIYYERLLALKPDLVIASRDGQPRRVIDRLKTFGVRIEEVDTTTLAGVVESFEKVGQWLGEANKGKQFAAEFSAEIERLKKTAQTKYPSVAVIVGHKPWVAVGKQSFIHGILEVLSIKNVFEDTRSPYPRISEEELIRRNPDFVIFLSRKIPPERAIQDVIKRWKGIPEFRAVQANRVLALEADSLVRPSRRLRIGIRKLAETLELR